MPNEFNIKNGFISNSDSRIIGALTANTISATTYFNLPTSTEVFVTGGTYTNGTTVFTNNTGGTFTVSGFYTGTTDVNVTGFTYNNSNTFTITNNTGGTLNATVDTMTGLTVNGNITVTGEMSGTTNSISTNNLINVALLYLSNNT
jgi:hypothetical protein